MRQSFEPRRHAPAEGPDALHQGALRGDDDDDDDGDDDDGGDEDDEDDNDDDNVVIKMMTMMLRMMKFPEATKRRGTRTREGGEDVREKDVEDVLQEEEVT